jgi:hypothetical protein
MKAYEETWAAEVEEMAGYDCMSDACVIRRVGDAGRYGLRIADTGTDPKDIERARLIAAAPEMARVLLRLHSGEMVSSGCVTEALRSAGVIPSFEEEAAALTVADKEQGR